MTLGSLGRRASDGVILKLEQIDQIILPWGPAALTLGLVVRIDSNEGDPDGGICDMK